MRTGNKILRWLSVYNVMLLLVLAALSAAAEVRYVNPNNTTPVQDYVTWATAATNIQDAIDVSIPGDEILVTNGVYRIGERATRLGTGTNRVAVTTAVTLRS